MKELFRKHTTAKGFTIVELLIVVVVIAILAAIIVISFNGITTQAKESSLKSDLSEAAKQLHIVKVESGNFPDSTSGVRKSDSTTFQYDSTANTFCLTATNPTDLPGKAFHIRESGGVQSGACSGHAVGGGGESNEIAANSPIQNVTQAQC